MTRKSDIRRLNDVIIPIIKEAMTTAKDLLIVKGADQEKTAGISDQEGDEQ